jgi:hypothetical protein
MFMEPQNIISKGEGFFFFFLFFGGGGGLVWGGLAVFLMPSRDGGKIF